MVHDFRYTEYGDIAPFFKWQRLEELCLKKIGIQTGPFGSQLHKGDYVNDGTPIITVEHIADNRITHKNLPLVSDEDKNRLSKYQLQTGDIVFSRVGSVDRNALVGPAEDGWLFSGRCLRVRVDQSQIIPTYLTYFLSHRGFKEYIRSIAVGATMPSINTKILSDIVIYFPPIPEQKAIAQILGSLDDKIGVNRRMNETLEGMAQALFKSWFMDFDPVIDNALEEGNSIPEELTERAEVRRKALADGTANREIAKQFPSTFQFTEEIGWIPQGWGLRTIGQEVTVVGGGTPSTKNDSFWNGIHPFCTPKDMSKLSSIILLETERYLTNLGTEKVSSGILPEGTLLMPSRAPIGYIAISENPVTVNQGIIALLKNEIYQPLFLMSWLRSNMDKIVERANGSTFLEISKKNFKPIPFLRPRKEELLLFNEKAESIHRKIANCVRNTNQLTIIRDTLLPKLISGELRIPDAEKLVEDAL